MEKHNDAKIPVDTTTKEDSNKNNSLASEAEAAAAEAEPMGSIAAAVPGSDEAAEDGLEPGQEPGAEDQAIRKESGPTAGTEFPAAEESSSGKKNAA